MSDISLSPRPPSLLPSRLTERAAISAVFALAGVATASWAVRIPAISEQVDADHAALGGALLCLSLGALATMRLTGALVERLGAGVITVIGGVLVCLSLVLPGLVGSVTSLAVALLIFGAATGTLNVAMNSVGIRLEAGLGRPVLPSLHAGFSFGGLAGSLVGGLVASSLTPAAHLVVVAGAGLLTVAAVARTLLAGDPPLAPAAAVRPGRDRGARPASSGAPLRGIRATIVTLGVIAGCTAFAEGALGDWAALHLVEDLEATAVLAAAGYAGFSCAMACGRLAGHWLLGRWGETRLLVGGSLLAAAGMLGAALSTSIPVALGGLVVVGLGLANVFPVAIARAGALAGSRGVSLASTVGYGGMLVGPALIGFLASHAGLPLALTTVSLLAVVAAGLATTIAGEDFGLARIRALPWTAAEVSARLRAALAPVGTAVGGAAQRHADSLGLLSPGPVTPIRREAPVGVASLFTPDTMLGRRTR